MELRELMASQNFKRIPLKKLATGHYKISALINKVPGDFIIDTGASSTCVAFASSTYFNISHEVSLVKAAGAGATGMDTHISKNNTLLIRGRYFKNFTLIIFDLTHVNNALMEVQEPPIHGIFGADLLKQCRAVIDYGRNCMYIK
jgi:predicted aspartyl protease